MVSELLLLYVRGEESLASVYVHVHKNLTDRGIHKKKTTRHVCNIVQCICTVVKTKPRPKLSLIKSGWVAFIGFHFVLACVQSHANYLASAIVRY